MKHGTTYAYRRGCHCEMCRKANTERVARQREGRRVRARSGEGVPDSVEHGLVAARNWGCRCDVCLQAVRDWNSAYRHDPDHSINRYRKNHRERIRNRARAQAKAANDKSMDYASRRWYQWTGPELEFLATHPDTAAKDVAKALGRTIEAVYGARRKLHREPVLQRMAGIGDGYQ